MHGWAPFRLNRICIVYWKTKQVSTEHTNGIQIILTLYMYIHDKSNSLTRTLLSLDESYTRGGQNNMNTKDCKVFILFWIPFAYLWITI